MWVVTCNSVTWAETARIARNDSTEVTCKSFVRIQDPKSFQDSLYDVLLALQRPKRIAQQTRWCCSVAVLGPVVLFVVVLFLLPFLPFFIFLSFLLSVPSLPPRFFFLLPPHAFFLFLRVSFWLNPPSRFILPLILFLLCSFFFRYSFLFGGGGGYYQEGFGNTKETPFASATPTSELQDKN